ncbi:MAG: hypothetical protein ACOYBL_07370 [Lachnospiraceae bacterium]|jgi:Skp family chaperone for outer membrane proteins
MEDILKKLYEIETTASSIMDDVLVQKQNLAHQMEKDIKDFDDATQADINRQLDELRQKLEAENKDQLKDLVIQTQEAVSQMDAYYQMHHQQLAQEVFEKLIRK